jgi:hypothetical protein
LLWQPAIENAMSAIEVSRANLAQFNRVMCERKYKTMP